jgi:hypothetical protein
MNPADNALAEGTKLLEGVEMIEKVNIFSPISTS